MSETNVSHLHAAGLLQAGQPAAARAVWEGMFDEGRDEWKVLHGIGVCHVAEGHPALGVAAFERALPMAPDNPDVLRNLGGALLLLKRSDEAIPYFERALAIRDADEHAHFNLAMALADAGRSAETIPHYERALVLNPNNIIARSNLIYMQDLGEDQAAAIAARQQWQAVHGEPLRRAWIPHTNDRNPKRRLRLGYCSGDFAFHSAAFCYGPVLKNHDLDQFEIICYSSTQARDGFTERFRDEFRWRDVTQLSPPLMVQQIRRDQIDVLIDLSGHSRENRLVVFACKPAPVQITAWGYAMGTGLAAMDYFFADPIYVPPTHEARFSERVIHLPVLTPFEPQYPTPAITPLPALAAGHLTFGAFDRLERVTARTLDLYAEVLRALPSAWLVVKSAHIDDPRYRGSMELGLSSRGVDLTRVAFRGKTTHYENMRALGDVDLLLDPYPHGGGVTILEGLWMGVPVITWCSDVTASRKGAAFLAGVGLPQFVATSPEHYTKIAMEWNDRREELATIRATLRKRVAASALCDHTTYTRCVEAIYRWAFERWTKNGV